MFRTFVPVANKRMIKKHIVLGNMAQIFKCRGRREAQMCM